MLFQQQESRLSQRNSANRNSRNFLESKVVPFSSIVTSYQKGISAEFCAEKLLKSKGFKIIGKRMRTPYGEIDILAQHGSDIVAVEVKQRRTLDLAKASISFRQQKRILNALMHIMSNRDDSFENYRIDVVCLDAVGRYEYIENAVHAEDLVAC